ncbi:LicD family protein [Pediococcus parvulus]|uniref:LicD family protein n=1 Tax=Pediococcus parvulus TaxID=54062 RepID=UPI0021A3B056|nr:LicD family protein [Pediococcus parvulus]MCT3034569.1 LicD family protein [Pediococcus parvulus]
MSKLKDVQEVELDLANRFAQYCSANNLRYYMIGGTFLGAVRHGGFIPWDDDMDFGMPRKDYEKFKEAMIDREKVNGFELEYYSLSPKYKYPFIKIVDRSIDLEIENGTEKQIVPCWIDIFPLDYIPSNNTKRKAQIFKLLFIRSLISMCNIKRINFKKENRPFYESLLMKIGSRIDFNRIFNLTKLYQLYDKQLLKYKENDGDFWINIMGSYKAKEIFSKTIFGLGKKYSFNNSEFVGPIRADDYLTGLYGDYMKLPPKDKRNHHHSKVL